MAIPEEFIQELKSRTDIVDVVSSYVNLKRSGSNLMGLCPFHNEKTPSFNVSRKDNFFYCFGCGAGGDVITFIRRIENLDYVDSIKFLAKRAGMDIPEESKDEGLSALRTRIYEANREAARFYHKQLYTPQGRKALEYLRGRHLTEKTIIHFGLGYSPPSRFELVNYMKKKGFTDYELIQANLANQSQRGNIYDRFFDRVMFPIIDLRGNVIAFGGRIMSDEKPKYLNTSETPVFNKSRNLFSLQFAKNKSKGQLILVEGYMDVIALHQAGFENAVATLGTALTQEQASVIKRYCNEIVICYDSDEAGQKATQRAISILRETGVGIKILRIPNGKDPDEYIRNYGEQGTARFRMLLDKSGNDVEFRLGEMRKKYNFEVYEQRVEFLREASQLIATFEDTVEQGVYIGYLAQEMNIDKSFIERQVRQYRAKKTRKAESKHQISVQNMLTGRNDRINPEKAEHLRAANAEEGLIALLTSNPDIAFWFCREVPPEKFITSFNRKVYEIIQKYAQQGTDFDLSDISRELTVEEVGRVTGILQSRIRENDPEEAKRYLNILEEEGKRLSNEDIAKADDDTLAKYMQELRRKKN